MAENYFSKFLFGFLIVFSLICTNLAEEVCTSTSTCLCNMNDDKYINISNVTNGQQYLTAEKENLIYYFSGCSYMTVPNNMFPNTTKNNCKDTTFCVFDKQKNLTYGFGKSEGSFKKGDSDLYFYIASKDETNQSSIITLGCTNLPESYLYALKPVSSTYNLVLFSPHSCVLQYHRGLSTGSVLLIIFFVCLTVYLVGGALVLHFLRGARGKEIIPNYEFWTGLPALVRDGFLFLLNGCNPVNVPTVESYDRI